MKTVFGKLDRILAFLLVVILCAVCFVLLTACGSEEETKYDVAIRVECSDGEIYEFPIGTNELHVDIPYDGVERKFGVHSYNLPDHPRLGDDWISPSGEGANVFQMVYLYTSPDGESNSSDRVVCARGDCVITIMADSTSDLWNFRSCKLFITVE